MLCAGALALALLSAAAESDPYFAWRAAPADSAAAVDRAVNAALRKGLQRTTRSMTCREAAQTITAPLSTTAQYYFLGPVRRWRVDVVPRDAAGRAALAQVSVYRDAPLFPFGHAIPLDPTMNVDGVLVGTDKLGHFFNNGLRSYDRYREALTSRGDERAAWRAAALLGVEEEAGWLGMGVCGVFSFADIHANLAGLRFYRALCDEGELVLGEEHGWHLTTPFRIARFVDPCWDESFATSAFAPSEHAALDAALPAVCVLFESDAVRARRATYARRGCAREASAVLDALVAERAAPDPSRWSVDAVCGGQRR
jgi:hypothetical protein